MRSRLTNVGYAIALPASVALAGCSSHEPEGPSEKAPVATSQQALLTNPPESNCVNKTHNGRTYFFCPTLRSRDSARTFCRNAGADLVSISSAAENDFITQNIALASWIGANDQQAEGTWRWASSNIAFWQGTVTGSSLGGQFQSWWWDQPDPVTNLTKDCATTDAFGLWAAQFCSLNLPYICEEFTKADCEEAVLGKARAAVPKGSEVLNPIVQADLLRCATPELTPCQASFYGAVRFDVYIASKRALAGTITPSQMLAIKRDRGRKANILARNSTWLTAYCAGDADGDLVPNSQDQCAGTPALTPTTDQGCTNNALPPGPSSTDFVRAMGAVGVVRDRDCMGTPPPQPPAKIRLLGGSLILFSDIQPASACERWYEVKVHVRRPNGTTVNDHFAVRRRESDADVSDIFSHRTTVCYDALRGTLSGQCRELAYPSNNSGLAPPPWPWSDAGTGDVVNVSMRTFDGNGNRSDWAYHTITNRP